ncbi:hypothetical protein WH43_07395 [Rheinheimera sp. KL1]|uniref:hypothetical protein n=1 Tax=Rheinheimera sp. KL1 TaxID=1635005 RepID=UPI0006A986C6|nr:hypothetical protein [Rheinheimera sp. KL1]KOO58672.1 hypothetical protein WH43_07395 [Rheinheimera sp. KL1]
MRKVFPLVVCALSGCSNERPTSEELLAALNELGQKKACLTSELFSEWPAKGDFVTRNKVIMERLADVGLVQQANGTFDLTAKGKDFFDHKQNGFCYASGHTISNVNLIKEVPTEQLPTAVYQAWQISFEITPMVGGEWIDNPELLRVLGVDFPQITQSQNFNVRLIKRNENAEIELLDPRFSFRPNHSFKMGW